MGSMKKPPTTLNALAAEITQLSNIVTQYVESDGGPIDYNDPRWPGYGLLSEEVEQARQRLKEAAKNLSELASDPAEHLRALSWQVSGSHLYLKPIAAADDLQQYYNVSTLGWLVHFQVPEAVPLNGSIPFASVAKACNVPESQMIRILRRCMLNRLFHEPSPGNVAHTPYSAALVTDPSVRNFVSWACGSSFKASTRLVEATQKWPGSGERHETAFSLANGEGMGLFEILGQRGNESQAKAFAQLMEEWNRTPFYDMKHTINGYDWQSVRGTVVDVGGSTGQTGMAIARTNEGLQVIVEDLPNVAEQGWTSLSAELSGRVSFLGHDFFQPQPPEVHDANVYVLRCVLHDHSDANAALILRNLVACMQGRPRARIVVIDGVMPAPGTVPYSIEKPARDMDIVMMQNFNAKERQREDWKALFKMADEKLELIGFSHPKGSGAAIMELALKS